MADTSKIDFKKIAVEMFSIIFAVMLALGIEDWMQDRERDDRAALMMERITAEVQNNRDELKKAIADNNKFAEGLKKALRKENTTFEDVSPFIQMSAGSINNSAWSSAQMTNVITYMPIETVGQLASLYDTQSYYTKFAQGFIQGFADYSVGVQQPDQMKMVTKKFITNLMIMNSLASNIVDGYDTFLSERKS